MSSLDISQTPDGPTLRLKLVGQIDADTDYTVVRSAGFGRIDIDCEGIKLINSTGLQRWIRFLGTIEPKTELALSRCSIRVITQLNMFPGFLGGRTVSIGSFFAPYFCESCDASCEILLETARDFPDPATAKAPKMRCPRCSGPAEFDGIEKKYFLFLKP